VKFVLVGSREVTSATVSRWFWVHSLVAPLALVAVLVALGFRVRRQFGIRRAR